MPPSSFPAQFPITPSALSLSQALLAITLAVIILVLYTYHPRVSQQTLLASIPWLLVGATLPLIRNFAPYPRLVATIFRQPWSYLLAIAIPGLIWLLLLDLSMASRGEQHHSAYLGMIGIGTSLPLVTFLILAAPTTSLTRLAVGVLVPLIALLAAIVIVFSFGFWHPDLVAYADRAAGFVIFGSLLHGTGTIIGVTANGPAAHSWLSTAVFELVTRHSLGTAVGMMPMTTWAWLFLWIKIAIAIIVVAKLGDFVSEAPAPVYGLFGIFGAITLAPGLSGLLVVLFGG